MIAVSVDRAVLIYLQRPLNTRQVSVSLLILIEHPQSNQPQKAWTVCIIIWLLSYLMTIPTFLDTRVRGPQAPQGSNKFPSAPKLMYIELEKRNVKVSGYNRSETLIDERISHVSVSP